MYTEYLGPIDRENLIDSVPMLEKAARKLQQGQLVAFPTETVYGLGGSILDPKAIDRIYEVKNRPRDRALPIHVANFDQLKFIAADIPDEHEHFLRDFFPAPLTVVLKKNPMLSPAITGGKESVAIRLSSDPVTRRLVEMTGCPLAVPSANTSGKPSPTKASHVLEDLNGLIDCIVDGGDAEYGVETTILSLENPKEPTILRVGAISHLELERAMGCKVKMAPSALMNLASSSEPILRSAVRLFSSWDEMKIYLKLGSIGKRLVMSTDDSKLPLSYDYFKLNSKNFYEALRFADRGGYAEVLVHCSPSIKQNEFLLNRLKQIART